jgi:hypothetical protein
MTMLANITGSHASGALLGESVTVKPAGSMAIQPVSVSGSGSITPFLQLISPRQ